jgi:hypothetical protein
MDHIVSVTTHPKKPTHFATLGKDKKIVQHCYIADVGALRSDTPIDLGFHTVTFCKYSNGAGEWLGMSTARSPEVLVRRGATCPKTGGPRFIFVSNKRLIVGV